MGGLDMIDTLGYAKSLELAGVSREQAEAHARNISKIVEDELVTKHDLKELEFRLTIKLGGLMLTLFPIGLACIGLMIKFLK
jgi:hypothetical protein